MPIKSSIASRLATLAGIVLAGAALHSTAAGQTSSINIGVAVTKAGSGAGTVASDVGGIDCGGTCNGTFADGTAVVLTATPLPGSQFTGWLGPCTGAGTCQFSVNGPTTVLATFATNAIGAPQLDIDGVGSCDALTDGLLTIRHLFGLSGPGLINGAVGMGATRSTDSQIRDFLVDIKPVLDVDGNGQTDALTDGLIVIRYMFGLRGQSLAAGAIGAGATRSVASIESLIQGLCLPSVCTGCFGPGAHSSAIDEFGHGGSTLSAPGGYLPPGGGGADVDGRIPTAVDTQVSGSTIYYAVARPAAASHTVTDNKGNIYTELDTGNYGIGAGANWVNATGYRIGANGGTNHVLTTPSVGFDEATLGWDEIRQGNVLVAHGHVFRPSGQTQSSPGGINVTGAAWVYVDWFGNGNTFGAEGFVWTVTAVDEGPAVGSQWQVVDARIVNHNNGWIQWKRWRRYFPTATENVQLTLAALVPAQGADFYAAAFQETGTSAVGQSAPAKPRR